MSFAVKMLEMLTSAYNRSDIMRLEKGEQPKTNIGKLFSLAGWGFDVILEQNEKVKLWDDIDQMKGVPLERFGNDFGVVRGEASDEILRIMIKVKLIAMLAAGNLDTVILSAASLFGVSAEDVKAEEVFPAKLYLYIDEDKLDQEHKNVAGVIAGLMARIKASGIGLRIFYQTYHGGEEQICVALLTSEHLEIRANPDATNKSIEFMIPLSVGIPMQEFVQVKYLPSEE